MSESDPLDVGDDDGTPAEDLATDDRDEEDVTALRARLARLELENERLREQYARAKRTDYRRSALALAGLGLAGLAAAVAFPDVRTVLIALGATGLFGAVLIAYLTPERFVAASVGERVYRASAGNFAAMVAELGLGEDRIYVPREDAEGSVRLFVPRAGDYAIPPTDALADAFVVTADERERGLALRPTGAALYEEFNTAYRAQPATGPSQQVDQLVDGLVEGFELVDGARVEVTDERATVAVDATVYGGLDGFDHPVVSFLAVGLADAVGVPVHATVTEGDDRADWLVTLTWPAD